MNHGPKQAPEMAPGGPKGQEDPREVHIRGVTKLPPRLDRKSPYGVRWTSAAGRPKEFFKTEKARDDRYEDLLKKAKKGLLNDELTREDRTAWRAFKTAIGDTPWQDVVAGWREHLANNGRQVCALTVSEAGKTYLEWAAELQKDAANAVSAGYYTHRKNKVTLFIEAFGANRMADLAPNDIEEWIDDLGFEANGTFNNYLKHVRHFYDHFRKQVKNPCDEVEVRDESVDCVQFLTVPETAALFKYARDHHRDALGRLALEAFAGLRFSSAFRLEKKDINFQDKGITLPAHKHKVGRRFYIDGLPDNVWAWLEATNDGCWAMEGSEWMHLKSKIFTDAKVRHPRNCLRHGFCTHHVAAFKNPGLTATLLTHRNQSKLWSNYNGRTTQADGKLYFTITPETCAKMAGAGS